MTTQTIKQVFTLLEINNISYVQNKDIAEAVGDFIYYFNK